MISITIVTGISVSSLIFNQPAMAQQQKLQGVQYNQTSSSLTKQPLLNGNSFQMGNMTFSHHTTSVNGIQLHYIVGGHGNPVVLLHGWPETWYEWHKVMPALAKNYTVIVPDLSKYFQSAFSLCCKDNVTLSPLYSTSSTIHFSQASDN
jgi:hypothetical protein